MAYAIAGVLSVELYFNGEEFPFSSTNTLNFIHIVAGSPKVAIPMIVLSVTDNSRWLLNHKKLADGVLIGVKLSSGDSNAEVNSYEFVLSHGRQETSDSGVAFRIEGYLNAPNYLGMSTRETYTGTSSAVLQDLATAVGLEYLGVGTNDSQQWVGGNRRIYQLAAYISQHGFATPDSCMSMAVDVSKTLVYRDITAMDTPTATFGLLDTNTDGVYPVVSWEPTANSGGVNLLSGYAYASVEQDTASDEVFQKHTAIGAQINEGGSLLVNGEIKSNMAEGRVRFTPVDGGNVHDQFERAQHQNRRGRSLFSSGLNVIVPGLTKTKVLDTVQVTTTKVKDAHDPSVVAYEGAYRLLVKVIYVVPGRIVEKLTFVRRTFSADLPASQPSDSSTTTSPPARTVKLPAKVSSNVDVPAFLSNTFEDLMGRATTAVSSALGSLGSSVTASLGTAVSSMTAAPSVSALLGTLGTDATAAQDSAIAAINAYRLTDPTDTAGLLAGLVADGKAAVDLVVATATPGIDVASIKSSAIAGVGNAVSAASGKVSSVTSVLNAATARVNNAMASVTTSGALDSLRTSSNAAVSGLVSSTVSSLSGVASSVAGQATTLLNTAATHTSAISSIQSGAHSAIDAAAA